MGVEPRELLRTGEPVYRGLNLGGRDISDEDLIRLMAEHPSLIQRPIVERGDRAVLGRPVERVKELL
jgi:arsenate reductase